MNIGIFDSGHGGTLVAEKLQILLPAHSYVVVDDSEHAPYGEREYEEIRLLTDKAIQSLLSTCPIIVIACNTATVAAIDYLRERYPDTQFVGFEPMIKPAREATQTNHFTLLATQATARAPRTNELIAQFASSSTIDIPDTTGWATAVDNRQADSIDLSDVATSIRDGSDTIIIGCTHYIAIQSRLEQFGVTILEPTDAIARRIIALTADSQQG